MPVRNAAPVLLGRASSGLDEGLAVTPPRPLIGTRVDLALPVELGLRLSLAFLWIFTAAISAWLPERSGVLELLARCGFVGSAGQAALAASCALNLTLGTLTLLRPSVLLYAVQSGAVVGSDIVDLSDAGSSLRAVLASGPLSNLRAVVEQRKPTVALDRPRVQPSRRRQAWRPSPPLRPATRDVPA